ncbi:FAD/FMN-containing dehydrogenase [Nannocystis exedens]|uniref:FAD/FMN-containing dehydrogenase n=1 Tax=Nannocystis exedens TaxID=54 RepID=A0A1I2E0Q8_9BACT|nr:FAD-binding oxidoreductase [Nannocystis exedens]PCC69209.1 Mitomycin radical oxidase [Nannocystis exedens]SFE86474.1 FAD/FMN-containing dehydrogenase [Nannocystis exedens]
MHDDSRLDPAALTAFKAEFRGELVEPGHARYDAARAVWNARIDRRPALIARCTGVADVVAAVRFARARGLLVAVRGGGHDVAGNAVCDRGLVLDMSGMKGVRVDPARRTVYAQAGLNWNELDRETQAFGLATTGGQCSKTGVVGVALGGGLGWLMRQHGLTIDNILSVDLVTADGQAITASADERPELFWGLRGGGGNFGVVTGLELRLHPVERLVVGVFMHPAERFADALRAFQVSAAGEPDEMCSVFLCTEMPNMPTVPAEMRGVLGVIIVATYNGPLAAAEQAFAPLRRFGPPTSEMVREVPYTTLQSMFDGGPAAVYGYRQCMRSEFFGELSDAAIAAVEDQLRRVPSAMCGFELLHLGGAIARVSEDATAFPRRDAPYFGLFQSTWKDLADSERHLAWTAGAWQALRPFALGGTYPNYIDDEPPERIAEAFGAAKYRRLVDLKRTHDPDNFFRMNKNIRP